MTDGQKVASMAFRRGTATETMKATRARQADRTSTNRCPVCGSSLFGCTEPATIMCSQCPAKWEVAPNGYSRGRRMVDQTIYEQAVWHAHLTISEDES